VGQNTFFARQDFCFYYMLKTNFLGSKKLGWNKKGGEMPPNAHRGSGAWYGLQMTQQTHKLKKQLYVEWTCKICGS